jgi:hypothetical protein
LITGTASKRLPSPQAEAQATTSGPPSQPVTRGLRLLQRLIAFLDVPGRTDGGEAVGGPRRDGPGAALVLPAKRASMWMWMWMHCHRRIAEEVLSDAQPGAQAVCGRLEHMFERVGEPSDGIVPVDGRRLPGVWRAALAAARTPGARRERLRNAGVARGAIGCGTPAWRPPRAAADRQRSPAASGCGPAAVARRERLRTGSVAADGGGWIYLPAVTSLRARTGFR